MQAQHDWFDIEVVIGGCRQPVQALLGVLSHSRAKFCWASPDATQLAWHTGHLALFERYGGVPLWVRIDNLKTGLAQGGGPAAVLNQSYNAFARSCRFGVDPCRVRMGSDKGKAERGVRTLRASFGAVLRSEWPTWEGLQGALDEQAYSLMDRLRCPVTGTSVREAFEAERRLLKSPPPTGRPLRCGGESPGEPGLPRLLRRTPLQRPLPVGRSAGGGPWHASPRGGPGRGRGGGTPPPGDPIHPGAGRRPLRGRVHGRCASADPARAPGPAPEWTGSEPMASGGHSGTRMPSPGPWSFTLNSWSFTLSSWRRCDERPRQGGPGRHCREVPDAPAHPRGGVSARTRRGSRAPGPPTGPLPRPRPRAQDRAETERRVATSLKLSGLPTGRTLEGFDWSFQPRVDRGKLEALATCAYVRERANGLFLGPPGVGKSHLAVALGVKAVKNGFSATHFVLDDLMHQLRGDAAVPPTRLKAKRYLDSALLIVDEVGFRPLDRHDANLFFRLVSHRYERGSIILTCNKHVRDWPETFAGDEILTTAILDRLLHHVHTVRIDGRSYRLRELDGLFIPQTPDPNPQAKKGG